MRNSIYAYLLACVACGSVSAREIRFCGGADNQAAKPRERMRRMGLKVIPLKLFYTIKLFLKRRVMNIHDMNITKMQ